MMRDWKRAMGVFVLLVALPAWASDMCPLAGVFFLPPVYLWALVAGLAGAWVRNPPAARVWGGLLGVGAIPALGAVGIPLVSAFHGSELKHLEMFVAAGLAVVGLLVAYVWAFRRLARVRRAEEGSVRSP